jgi:hypothetical protein
VGMGDGELGERACWGSGEGEGEEGLEEVLGRTGGSVEEVELEVGPIDVCILDVVNGSAEEITVRDKNQKQGLVRRFPQRTDRIRPERPEDARIFGIVRRFLVERGQDGRVDGDDRVIRGLLSRAVSRSPHQDIHHSQDCGGADVDYISRFGCRLKEARRR